MTFAAGDTSIVAWVGPSGVFFEGEDLAFARRIKHLTERVKRLETKVKEAKERIQERLER